GAGAAVASGAGNWVMSRNSFSGNGSVTTLIGGAASGQVGIDLQSASDIANTGTSPFVTRNDTGDPDAGGNALFNFPVIESALLANGSVTPPRLGASGSPSQV